MSALKKGRSEARPFGYAQDRPRADFRTREWVRELFSVESSRYLHDLEIQVGKHRLTAPLGFSDRLGVRFNLLGRVGIFSHFSVRKNITSRIGQVGVGFDRGRMV